MLPLGTDNFKWMIITQYYLHFPLTWWVTQFDYFIVSNTSKIYSSSTTDGSDGPDVLLVASSPCGQCATHGGIPLILPLISTTKGPVPSNLLQQIQSWQRNHAVSKHNQIHPWKLTWNQKMQVWKIIFLFKQVIFRFHVNFPGCCRDDKNNTMHIKKEQARDTSAHQNYQGYWFY